MLDESADRDKSPRTERLLRSDERDVIEALIAKAGLDPQSCPSLVRGRVRDLNDGGMGSITFNIEGARRTFGRIAAEAISHDSGGTKVIIALILDSSGDVFELDVWKVDYSKLLRFPKPSQLTYETTSVID